MIHRNSVGVDKSPFAFTIFGTKFYVISDPKHAKEVDKNNGTLSFDEFIFDFVKSTGVSDEGMQACYFKKLPEHVSQPALVPICGLESPSLALAIFHL